MSQNSLYIFKPNKEFLVFETIEISPRVFAFQGSKHPEERERTGREECEILGIADFLQEKNHQASHREGKKDLKVINPISGSKDKKPHFEIKEW